MSVFSLISALIFYKLKDPLDNPLLSDSDISTGLDETESSQPIDNSWDGIVRDVKSTIEMLMDKRMLYLAP